MTNTYYFDLEFHQKDLPKKLTGIEFDQCRFVHCDFSERDLSESTFIECEFHSCNLSLCRTIKTSFQQVIFRSCKMVGLHFEHCNRLGLDFGAESCVLDQSIFYQSVIKHMKFIHCSLKEVDFTETQAQHVAFLTCDLLGATFDKTQLEQADFRTAKNYRLQPSQNNIKGAQFSVPEVLGLLSHLDIQIG